MDKLTVNFKIATVDDVERIIDLCNECFNENTSVEYARKVFEETINDKNQIYVIGECDGKVVAHTKITIIPTIYDPMSTYSIINHVCVKPDYRRHNIATQLLDEVTRISKEHGCHAIELWSKNFRQPAHACYQKYGFMIEDAKFFSKEI